MSPSGDIVVECAIAVEPGPDPDCLGNPRQVLVFYREAGWRVAIMIAGTRDEVGAVIAAGIAANVQRELFHGEHPFERDDDWAREAWS